MALSGIRDMSAIEEPPGDRQPVQTYVLEHDWGILGDAMRRELDRGGQVYYLHNRVENIESTAGRIRQMLGRMFSIGIAHGKMSESQLSRVMQDMADGEIHVLVCTTIIETGIDIPNVNTLIIEDADRMGLSQLHQIRGRIGRSPRRAYAYLSPTVGKDPDRGGQQAPHRYKGSMWSSAPASKLPCGTWRFAARAICWGRSNPVI